MTAAFEIFLSYSRRDNAVPDGASPDGEAAAREIFRELGGFTLAVE